MLKRGFAFVLSFVVGALSAYLWFVVSEPLNGYARLVGFPLIAFGAGYIQGRILGHQSHKWIGGGTMLAFLMLWSPVIIVTYGAALACVPVLMGLAAGAAWGARRAGGQAS